MAKQVIEKGPGAFYKKVVLTAALTFSFIYYVTFVQIPLFTKAFDADSSRWPMFLFGFLGAMGCLLAGRLVDLAAGRIKGFLTIIAVCSLLEGIYGLVWPRLDSLFPLLGLVLGFHIIYLLVLLGWGLGRTDRFIVACFSVALIYLAVNLMMAVAGPEQIGQEDLFGKIAGGGLILAAIFLAISERTGLIQPAPQELWEPPVAGYRASLMMLSVLFVFVALDSFCFYGLLKDPLLAVRMFPGPTAWVINGLHHVLAALVILVVLVRWGVRSTLAVSALGFGCFAVLFYLLDLGGIHSWYFLYSVFVCGYNAILFSVWPSIWIEGKAGRITSLGLMIAGFGGSVGGIGLYMLLAA